MKSNRISLSFVTPAIGAIPQPDPPNPTAPGHHLATWQVETDRHDSVFPEISGETSASEYPTNTAALNQHDGIFFSIEHKRIIVEFRVHAMDSGG